MGIEEFYVEEQLAKLSNVQKKDLLKRLLDRARLLVSMLVVGRI